MIQLSSDLLLGVGIGVGIGVALATLLSLGQSAFGQFSRQTPCGCLLGVLCIAIGLCLLVVGGYVR